MQQTIGTAVCREPANTVLQGHKKIVTTGKSTRLGIGKIPIIASHMLEHFIKVSKCSTNIC